MPEQRTMNDLLTMQAWPLDRKISVTQTRLVEWVQRYNGEIYISFSGGKDSTVLADLAARVYKATQRTDPLTLVFVNTGLEYPEIQKFVKYFAEWLRTTYEIPVNLEIRKPEMSFPEVLSKYGYPVIGKEVAKVIYYAKRGSGWAINRLEGLDKNGNHSKFKERYMKYKFMIDAPFDTTQNFERHLFSGTARRRREVLSGQWKPGKYVHFTLRERGKVRPIDAPHINDRQIHKTLCNNVLIPLLVKAAEKITRAGPRSSTVANAVGALVAAGVIDTPDYWLANYSTFPSLDALLCALGGAVK